MAQTLRSMLVEQVLAFVGESGSEHVRLVRRRVSELLRHASDDAIAQLVQRLATTGDDWGYHPPNELARAVNHALGDLFVEPDSELIGASNLPGGSGNTLLAANHLSFSDANLLAYLLHRADRDDVVEHLTVLVGPKVYTETFRRFSSLCFGSIKLPQSQDRASGEAVMPRREVAKLAARTIEAAHGRMSAGDDVLVFVEGTRSRSGEMQPALAAVSRYLEPPARAVVPIGIAGSERLVPIGDEHARRARVRVSVGAPISTSALLAATNKNRGLMMHVVGCAIAAQLPPTYRGAYADTRNEHADARRIATQLTGHAASG